MQRVYSCLLAVLAIAAIGFAPAAGRAAVSGYEGTFTIDIVEPGGGVILSISTLVFGPNLSGSPLPITVSPFLIPGSITGPATGMGFFGAPPGTTDFTITMFHIAGIGIGGGAGAFATSLLPPGLPCSAAAAGGGVCLAPGTHHLGGILPVGGAITLSGMVAFPTAFTGPLFGLGIAAGSPMAPNATGWTTGTGLVHLNGQPGGPPGFPSATTIIPIAGSAPSSVGTLTTSEAGSTYVTLVTPYRIEPSVSPGLGAIHSYDDLAALLRLELHMVPEPGTAALLGLGLIGLATARRRGPRA